QFGHQRQAIRAAGLVVLLMGVIPGLPKIPFLVIGVSLLLIGGRLSSAVPVTDAPTAIGAGDVQLPVSPQQLAIDARTEPLELDIAYNLIELVDDTAGGDLLDRVSALRKKLAGELGYVMPSVRTRDSSNLPTSTYVIKVHGVEVGRGLAMTGRVLVIGDALSGLPGDDVREPVFGLAARWVPVEFRVQAEIAGNTVVDRSTLIVTHLAEVVRRRAGRLLGRTDVKMLLDGVRASDPQVVDDLTTAGVTTGEVQRVLAALLSDGIPIRDLVRILEAVGERARVQHTTEALVEAARSELGAAITSALAVDGRLYVLTLAPTTESRLLTGLRSIDGVTQLELLPAESDELARQLTARSNEMNARNTPPVLVASGPVRPALAGLVKALVPGLPVVSYAEIGDHLEIEVIGNVDMTARVNDQPTDPNNQERHAYATSH
ncbi:MAG: flagellar biosynthesis protein FlhA, partial [Ilumatobacteraceae bacterium]|nr:flagellar biosynthesis protein FlhA [Ilumatobacteraceae bacterium]